MDKPVHIAIQIDGPQIVWFSREEEFLLSEMTWKGETSFLSFVRAEETLLGEILRLWRSIVKLCGWRGFASTVARAAVATYKSR